MKINKIKANIALTLFIALATLLGKEVFVNYDVGVAAYSFAVGVISVYLYHGFIRNFESDVKRSHN